MLDAHHKSAWDTMLVVGMIFEVEMDTELGYDLISKNACNGYLKNAEITNPFTNWWLSLVQIDLQVGWSVKFGWFLPVIYFSWNLGECIVIPNWTSHQLQTIFWGASYFWSAYYTPRIGLYIFHLPLSLSLHILYAIYIYIIHTVYTDYKNWLKSPPSFIPELLQPARKTVSACDLKDGYIRCLASNWLIWEHSKDRFPRELGNTPVHPKMCFKCF